MRVCVSEMEILRGRPNKRRWLRHYSVSCTIPALAGAPYFLRIDSGVYFRNTIRCVGAHSPAYLGLESSVLTRGEPTPLPLEYRSVWSPFLSTPAIRINIPNGNHPSLLSELVKGTHPIMDEIRNL